MNKLDYLAQKEEELRKLNEQLDSKHDDAMKLNEPKKDLFANNNWTVKEPELPTEKEHYSEDDNEEEHD